MRGALQTNLLFVPMRDDARRDRREGAEWTKAQRLKNRLIRAALHAALVLVDRVSQPALLAIGRVLGRAATVALPRARRIAEVRAARCMPRDSARRVASESFVRAGGNLARCLLLRRPMVRALDHVRVTDVARRVLAESLAAGDGAIFVSAHVGPFEAVAAAVAELGYDPAVVVRESYDPGLNELVDHHRRRRGLLVIHRGSPRAPFAIVRALRAGQPVGFLPDLGARVPSVELPFLGELVAFPIGPQLVALRTGAPVLIGTLKPSTEPGPAHELLLERLDPESDLMKLTHRVANALERAIMSAPEEWLWMSPPIRRPSL